MTMFKLRFILVFTILFASLFTPAYPFGSGQKALADNRSQYQANWESLDSRPMPQWWVDAKFGIFIHWGLYSVPAYGPRGEFAELYVGTDVKGADGNNRLREKGSETWEFHRRTYGEDFEYKDFAPLFKAELFDADQWAELFKQAGAKYVVLVSRHNTEAFCLWPAPDSENWNAVDTGPHRDLCGDLSEAVKKKGLKMGFYYGFLEWYNPYSNLFKENFEQYIDQRVGPQLRDLVTRYRPSLLWMDGDWSHSAEQLKSLEFLAWLFNESAVCDEIVVNDRWGRGCRGKHGGHYTTEYGAGYTNEDAHPWEETRGIGHSFGYNRAEILEDYATGRELVLTLVDLVSRGGNLLLNIGPGHDGRIPLIMAERLTQMGQWLKVNGAAIYGTRPWKISAQWSAGKKPSVEYGKAYMAKYSIREIALEPEAGFARVEAFFTCKDDTLFAILPRWPEGNQIILKEIKPSADTTVTMLGYEGPLAWEKTDQGIAVQLPGLNVDQVPCSYAWTVKLTHILR